MRKHCTYFIFAILISILVLQMPHVAYAQSPAISNGLTWLNAVQSADGSWDSASSTADIVPTTSAALESLSVLNSTASPNYVNAANWLAAQQIDTTRSLAERLSIFPTSTADKDSILLYVDDLNHAWGGYDDFTVNILDTAYALAALKKNNYADYQVLFQAINYLTANQKADGGWGFKDDTVSNVYMTASVLQMLSSYNNVTFNVQTNIDKAVVYLLSKQNSDGGFGSSPSNVYESGLALDTLIASGASNISTVVSNGIGYLTTTQLADGSWNEDPYSTALALRALASARPNLVISSGDISLSKSMPQENETVIVTATVRNTGFDSASGIVVRFFLGDPSAGGSQIGNDQIISTLPVGGSSQAAITASFMGTGGKTIFVVADPDGTISETSESDNKSSTRIWVATAPDLAVYSEDLKPSTYVPVSGTAFALEYTIRNIGESAADAFTVSLYDGDPSTGSGHLLSTANVSGLGGTEVRTGTVGVTLTGDGSHTLYLTADSGALIPELSETNNTGSVTIQVGGVQQQADLVAGAITLTPSRPHAGESVQISASVRNEGLEDASSFTVEIFDGAPESNGILIHTQTISLAAGAEQTITANWTVTAGIHDLYVILDRMNGIIETNENNNRSAVRVMTDMVDISISATDLVLNPSHPVSGDSVALSITVHNLGIRDTGAFNLALYDGDPGAGGEGAPPATPLQAFNIANIGPDGSTTLTYTFTAEVRTYRFYAVADTENTVAELYEDNNLAIRSLTIKSPSETSDPDNIPTEPDLPSMLASSQTLTISAHMKVTFENTDNAKTANSASILIFEDKNGDGRYTQGIDTLLGKGIYASARFDDDQFPEVVLLITQVYSPALYMEGSVYLIEHDGKIKWGPVYLKELEQEVTPVSYESATLKTETNDEGKTVISVRVNDKNVILDRDGYLKQPEPGTMR